MIIFEGKTKLEINYRLPNEFIWVGCNWLRALLVWTCYYWNEDYPYIYEEWGFRFLGIEIIFTI